MDSALVFAGLRGQVAIVTGGAGGQAGLGLTTTEALLGAGAAVAVWDNDASALETAGRELRAQGLDAFLQTVDVTDVEQVRAAYASVKKDLGPADTLVNNAVLKMDYVVGAREHRGPALVPFWELDLARVRRAWEVNVIGALVSASVVAPDMLARRRGSIISVVTSPETQRSPRHIPYGPSKAMLEAMTRAMAAQLIDLGAGDVRANAILPGGSVNRRGEHDPRKPAYDCLVPLTLWLASDEARGVTGQVLSAREFRVHAPDPGSVRAGAGGPTARSARETEGEG